MQVEVEKDQITGYVDIHAAPEKVFDALCHSERWWGSPDSYRVAEGRSDLRLGGEYISEGVSADGASPFSVKGKFVAFEPPILLAYTWNPSWEKDMPETTVTYRLEPIETGTRVHLTHGSFAHHNESAASHYQGWSSVLGWLQAYCEVK